ncbi:hypothetical protein Tco_0652728 [Tanacetum coccineum]|uniref:Transmembrane protein n=1 Tax=Tanacetum coccineum TaxID=301880 RepID=A0ABQ4WYG8_9ASTR
MMFKTLPYVDRPGWEEPYGASFTHGTVSSIPIGGNISPGGFSPSILLVVILVMVVIVVVDLVVVVIGVVIVVAIIGVVFVIEGVSFIIKLSFLIIGFLLRIVYCGYHDPLTFDHMVNASLKFGFIEAITFPSMLSMNPP